MIATATPVSSSHHDSSAAGNPLTALVVSREGELHRELGHHLSEAGYAALHCRSTAQALAILEASPCQFLLVDAELPAGAGLELCREAGTTRHGAAVAKLLLLREFDNLEFADLLQAGVDDCLLQPTRYLELISRMRAAARTVEFRRRLENQLGFDALTQLPTQAAAHRHLEALLQRNDAAPHSLLILAVDHFEHQAKLGGAKVASAQVQQMAEVLSREQLESEQVSYWGSAQFCVICDGQDMSEAAARAEELRQAIRDSWHDGSAPPTLTISGAVAESASGGAAADLIDHAFGALEVARSSGGDCVTRFGEHDKQLDSLSQHGDTDRLFQSTLAADLMTPSVLTFSETHGAWHAANLLSRHRLAAAAVVDASGKCVGLVDRTALPSNQGEAGHQHVASFVCAQADQISEETSLESIMQRFAAEDLVWLIVTRHGRPTGLIARDSLAAFSQPLSLESLQRGAVSRPLVRSAELLVPEHIS